MIKINLLPVGVSKKKEKIMIQIVVAVLFILATLGGLGLRWYTKKMEIETVNKHIAELKEQIAKRQDIKDTLTELEAQKNKLDQQIEAINRLDQGRKFFIRVLDKITESVPHNQVWLQSIKNAGGGGVITIKGAGFEQDAIAQYLGNLSIIPCDPNKSDEMSAEECRERAGSSKEALAMCDNYKARICIEKDKRCRVESEPGKIEKNFEECRKFYKQIGEDGEQCEKDVTNLESRKRYSCQAPQPGASGEDQGPDSPACKKVTAELEDKKLECVQLKSDRAKLHEDEFVRYDAISLKYMKLQGSGDKSSGGTAYGFEITVSPAGGK